MRLVCSILFLTCGVTGSALKGNTRSPNPSSSQDKNRPLKPIVSFAADASSFKNLAELRARQVDDLMQSKTTRYNEDCPPPVIPLKSGELIRIDTNQPNFHGSGSDLYISQSRISGQQVIVKYIKEADAETIKDLQDDYAFMHVIKGEGVVPKVYDVDEAQMSPQCSIRVIVSDFVGMLHILHNMQ
jgi:hypothetical protein